MNEQNVLLLIGYKDDPHLGEVSEMAEKRAFHGVIFDPYCEKDYLTVTFGDKKLSRLSVDGEEIDCHDIVGVWLRQKPVVIHPGWSPLEQSAAAFRQNEWRVALRHLPSVLINAVWMNPLMVQAHISIKPNQLELAQSCGFLVPETRITNNVEDVLELFDKYEKVIYKCLYWASFPDQTGVLTNQITRKFVLDNKNALSKCPGIFQRFIDKKYELRVTMVGEEIFVAKINSPKQGKAAVDWRHAHLDDIFEAHKLDESTEQKIRNFQLQAGLKFGAYDLVVSTNGLVYFLECNPAGQYLWLKEKCGIDISPAIVSFFEQKIGFKKATK